MNIRIAAPVAVLLLAGGAAAGCGSHSVAHAIKSAEASASAMATNPAVLKAEKEAKAKVIKCATKIGVIHLTLHPVKGLTAIVNCAAPKSQQAAVRACTKKVINKNGVGKGKLAADEAGLINCLAVSAANAK